MIFSCSRRAGDLHEGAGPVHPAHVDHVPRERGAPPCHDQLLHQLPHLLLRLQAVQVCPLQRAGGLLPQPQGGGRRASPGQVCSRSTFSIINLSVTCLCVTFLRFSSLYDDGYERFPNNSGLGLR